MTGEPLSARGRFVVDDGLEWYRIDDYDLLDPFLINVVTPGDQWIFVSTSGALTAGRWSAENSLFPYETDDRLHRSGGRTGPLTVIRVPGAQLVWQPFDTESPIGPSSRSLAKTAYGDRLRFTERHPDLGLTFTYTWTAAGRFGLVRSCELTRDAGRPPIAVDVLDGLVNVLPAGVELSTQQRASTLVDGYRRSELDHPSGLALFTLEALVSDRADPAEALRSNTIWSDGLPAATVVLSERQVRRFRSGGALAPEHLVTGEKGAFLQAASVRLDADRPLRWFVVADVGLDHCDAAELRSWLLDTDGDPASRWEQIRAQADEAHRSLGEIVAAADGRQMSADKRATVHHFANVLFNCMRGGVFLDDHRIHVGDVERFVAARNRLALARFAAAVAGIDDVVEISALRRVVSSDPDLVRLVNEYLPLTFSRRHGDPSRPWNRFTIPERGPDGHLVHGYEGNWRDIFQNWDALLHSFPDFIESVIAKFLNATTLDGHNPYRITHDGIDWEVPEEDDSWGHFGYWGDHQIVYLHRLLLVAERFHPGLLESQLALQAYSSADVPYRMRPYEEIVADPKHTLEFDHERHAAIEARVAELGADGKLTPADGGGVHLASLAEKLMIPALAKVSNLVADAGIWMNTQRPEWNDANNALVGNGVSVVTSLYLREYVRFLDSLFERAPAIEVPIGRNVLEWMRGIGRALAEHADLADRSDRATAPAERRALLDALGTTYSDYRSQTWREGTGEPLMVAISEIRDVLAVVRPHLDRVARRARRSDGLVHTYWLLRLEPGAAHLEPLYEMLEGQVATLSGDAAPPAVLSTVDALFSSDLYRADQQTFILYPNRLPPSFLDKNRVPVALDGPVLDRLAEADTGVVCRDVEGALRFDPRLESADHLARRLDALEADPEVGPLVRDSRAQILAAYEHVFEHRSFTGRSQTMHRYEGLGSIYWHMVSKLLFAVQERLLAAVDDGADGAVLAALADRYHRIAGGLGYRKSAALQGAFPTDPHSHTPAHTGAQQPGMTGQVKEGVLIRWGELGVLVEDGCLRFQPVVLDPAEFLTEPRPWDVLGPGGVLEAGTLGFTYCGVPIVYHLVDEPGWAKVAWSDGRTPTSGVELDRETSMALFARTGRILRIDVGVARDRLR